MQTRADRAHNCQTTTPRPRTQHVGDERGSDDVIAVASPPATRFGAHLQALQHRRGGADKPARLAPVRSRQGEVLALEEVGGAVTRTRGVGELEFIVDGGGDVGVVVAPGDVGVMRAVDVVADGVTGLVVNVGGSRSVLLPAVGGAVGGVVTIATTGGIFGAGAGRIMR